MPIALIGRGESVLSPDGVTNLADAAEAANVAGENATQMDSTKHTDDSGEDEESGGENLKEKVFEGLLSSNEESMGWRFPKVKLASWNPEDEKQWESEGKFIARRNLVASIPNLTCAFGVWLVWSVIVSKIQLMHDQDPSVYHFPDWGSPTGKTYNAVLYLLPGVAGLSGGTLRIPNSFMTQCCGGRNVVYSTSILLCIPMIIAGVALKDPNVPFNLLLMCSLLSGVGGGAFASSMSNISFYYPKSQQGYCLGMNGGIGNLGVSISQLIAPIVMATSYGKDPISPAGVPGWPNNAGWLWFPLCAASSILAFFWMSNQPLHGSKSNLTSHFNFYWMEIMGFIASFIAMVTLIATRNSPAFTSTSGGKIAHKFMLVAIAAVIEHLFIWFLTPKKAKARVHKQAAIFKDKHTYIMTWLYIMCFGSFIGYSGAFPKLITDLFGYIQVDGCMSSEGNFLQGGGQASCENAGGSWVIDYTITNPNAPNVFAFAWMGALVGSLVRPVGGVLADKYGGAKVTMIAIVWCTAAAIAQGFLVIKTRQLDNPEKNFGWFLFLFLNLFFCTGAMNGTTFRTIGVLFEPEISGPVLGWSSAIASYGAFIIPALFGIAIAAERPENTFFGLAAYYVSCGILNFWYYLRPGAERKGV